MMKRCRGVGLTALFITSGVCADLNLDGPRCGKIRCQLNEYCSTTTSKCAPCHEVCDSSENNHNYDPDVCVKLCQDYIHDMRYVRLGNTPGAGADYKSVQTQARVAIIISSVVLALLVLVCLVKCLRYTKNNKAKFTWRYFKKKLMFSKSRVKQYPTDPTLYNSQPTDAPKGPKNELKLDVRGSQPAVPRRLHHQPLNVQDLDGNSRSHQTDRSIGVHTPKTVSTSLSNRHPAEDTTLDYSYDNMGLNVTPPPIQGTTTNF